MQNLNGLIVQVGYFAKIFIMLTFAYSAYSKSRDLDDFANAISNFKVLPDIFIRPAAYVFTSLEFAVVVLILAGGRLQQAGFLLAVGLLVIFTLALIRVLRKGIRTKCNCFGRREQDISEYDVGRNVVIIIVILAGLFTDQIGNATSNLELVEKLLLTMISIALAILIASGKTIALMIRDKAEL